MNAENFNTLVIVNPKSGGSRLGLRWRHLKGRIRQTIGPFSYRFTERPGHATDLATTALDEGYEMVVALGGDGTISEVVNGFFSQTGARYPEAVMGILPYGTGGDFCKTVGVYKNFDESLTKLRGKNTRPIDVGRLTYTTATGETDTRHFINIASFGIAGLVDDFVNRSPKILGGTLSFALATLRAMTRYRPQKAMVRLDENPAEEMIFQNVVIANGQFFGGGMHIAPNALIDDGQFDVVILDPMSLKDLLLHGHRVYRGTHLHLPLVRAARACRIEAQPTSTSEEILLDVDGETPGKLPATFTLLPRALSLKVA